MKNKIFDLDITPEIIRAFGCRNDKGLYVSSIGYHNFEFIEPITWIHRQSNYLLHYVISGSGTLVIEGKEFFLTEKQIFFVPAEADHMYFPNENDKWKYIWFNFDGDNAPMICSALGLTVDEPYMTVKNSKHIEAMLIDMMESAFEGKTNEYSVKGVFYSVVGELSAPDAGDSLTQNCATDAAKLLAANFSKSDFNLSTLCRLLYVSHSALCKAFKKEFDTTPLKYLIRIRMEHAAKLLRNSTIPVRDIAELSGYKDEIHFMKTFKSYYGTTATEFRKNL